MQIKDHWLSLEYLHRLLILILSIADDVWLAAGINLNQSLISPISDELGSSSIFIGLFL